MSNSRAMGRPRKHGRPLPPYCYARGKWVYYRPRGESPIRIGSVDDSDAALWREYERAAVNHTTGNRPTLSWMLDSFRNSPRFQRLAVSTRKQYETYINSVCAEKVAHGSFGDTLLADLSPGTFRRYMDLYADKPVIANRRLAMLKVAFGWAFERDMVASNPVKAVSKHQERPRDRYVTDAEYQAVLARAPAHLQACMELAYLCRLRSIEVLALGERDLTDAGIRVDRVKGSKAQIIGWSGRLRSAIDIARSYGRPSLHLITTQSGTPLSMDGFRSGWNRLMRHAKADGAIAERFTFHDLKAKGVSDFDGDRRKAAGHRTERAADIYDRKREIVPATR